jgi:hypothetical protein
MDFFKDHASLKNLILKHFFHKLIQWFVNVRFGNQWQVAIDKIHETLKTIIYNFKQANLSATKI